jgi:hypothetical protein
MALGIGATTAIFSVVDATLLRPLPYPRPERLVSIEDDLPGVGSYDVGMSQPEWLDLQRSGIFEYVSPSWFDDNNLTGSARPERVRLSSVAPDYFALLGVPPQLGRGFPADDCSIGIRVALGAERRTILRLVLWQGLGVTLTGAAVGLVCALIVARLMAGLLYSVGPADPPTFAGVALALVAGAMLACYIPARRAVRIDPMTALRSE